MLDLAALAAFNRLRTSAPWARARLARFAGHRARLTALPLTLEFRIGADGTVESLGEGPPDVEIALPAGALLAALQGREALLRGAHVSGSAEFAETLSFVLRNLEWDAEEDLSRLVGDIAAPRLLGAARHVAALQKERAQRLAQNLAEYFLYENAQSVAKSEAGAFAASVQAVCAQGETLDKRLAALEAKAPA